MFKQSLKSISFSHLKGAAISSIKDKMFKALPYDVICLAKFVYAQAN